jgi:hypothetical protein
MKIEILEGKVFTLESENTALHKSLEAMENQLVKLKEIEDELNIDI